MSSRTNLLLLVVATCLAGVCLAGSIEDEFYRSVRSPSIAGLDDGDVARSGGDDEHRHQSWRGLAMDTLKMLKVLSENSDHIEDKMERLCEKVDQLDVHGEQNYNLHYAKKLLNEQRAAIQALQSGAKGKSYGDLLRETDEYMQPKPASSYRKKERSSGSSDSQLDSLYSLKQL